MKFYLKRDFGFNAIAWAYLAFLGYLLSGVAGVTDLIIFLACTI